MEGIEGTRSSSPRVNDALAIAHKANTDAKRKKKSESPHSYPLPSGKSQPVARWQIKAPVKCTESLTLSMNVKRNQLNKSESITLKEVVQFNKILCQVHSWASGYPVQMLFLQLLCFTFPCANDYCFLSSWFLLFCKLVWSHTPALPAPKVFPPKTEDMEVLRQYKKGAREAK